MQGRVAQSDALGHLHVHCLREDDPAFTSGVALSHTSGEAAEPTIVLLAWLESEEKGERDMAREIPTLTQYNRKKKSTLLKKKKIKMVSCRLDVVLVVLMPRSIR